MKPVYVQLQPQVQRQLNRPKRSIGSCLLPVGRRFRMPNIVNGMLFGMGFSYHDNDRTH